MNSTVAGDDAPCGLVAGNSEQRHIEPRPGLPAVAWKIVLAFLVFHFIVCATFDRTNPRTFEVVGDRSDTRLNQINTLLAQETPARFFDKLFSSGLPGDYVWHAGILHMARGLPYPSLWVISAQILLWMATVVVLGYLVRYMGFGDRIIILSMVLYLLLPHSLIFPHTLISEGFFVPFVLFATYFTVRWVQNPERRYFIAAAVLWALAGLTRPESLLAPFVVAAFLLLKRKCRVSVVMKFLLVYCGILAFWFVPSLLLTGTLNISSQSAVQFNNILHRKGEFLILTLPHEERQREWQKLQEIPSSQFTVENLASLYARYPFRVVMIHAYETGKLLFRLDEIKILTYLDVWQPDADWQRNLASQPLSSFVSKNGPYIAVAFAGSLVWLVILLSALKGFVTYWQRPEIQLILVLVAYNLLSVLPVDNTSARLRSCTNYAFVLAAAAGYYQWLDEKRQRRVSRT
jgi:hypothetical protein